eukprot:c23932_g1_i1 orf=90-1064(+)
MAGLQAVLPFPLPPCSCSHTCLPTSQIWTSSVDLHPPPTSACSALPQRGRRHKDKKATKERSQSAYEEDVFTVTKGWTVNVGSTEEMIEMAGVNIPIGLNEKLLQERKPSQSCKVENKTIRSTHKILKVISGKVAGKKLLSPADMTVRPMMEVVRAAIFNSLKARVGGNASFSGRRWLDLYSGTGSVGIEALSRGCAMVHFVELDPWVVAEVLKPNLEATHFKPHSVIHKMAVEAFLEQSLKPNCELGSFDYISVTPPYEAVDYNLLMGHLAISSLVGADTWMVVEYPSELEIHDSCGQLLKILHRRYGRTHVAIYGPVWAQKS